MANKPFGSGSHCCVVAKVYNILRINRLCPMTFNLDSILLPNKKPGFKSEGERRIAELLDRCGVQYMYEAPVAVQHQGRLRIWYPDFLLPDLGLHVEYFGIECDPAYDRSTREKMTAYAASGISVISVYPCHLPHLPQYLNREMREHTNYRRHLVDAAFFRTQRSYSQGRYRG